MRSFFYGIPKRLSLVLHRCRRNSPKQLTYRLFICVFSQKTTVRILLLSSLFFLLPLSANQFDSKALHNSMSQRFDKEGTDLLLAWDSLLTQVYSEPITLQLTRVNSFFNHHIRYSDDLILWKKSDYWATLVDTLGVGAGDCEDFTIAKYLTLRALGVPDNSLRLIYVKAQIGGAHSKKFQAHMVLGYFSSPSAVPLILDNLVKTIKPANKRTDLSPVFSFNSQGLWIGSQQTNADSTVRLSRWRDLLDRNSKDGFIFPAVPPIIKTQAP